MSKRKLPALGNAWRTDELYVKFSGNLKYMYEIMDDETRFWIAQQVSGTKFIEDVRPLFKKANEIAGKRPNVLISDGASNYNQAFKDEFFHRRKPRSRHIRHIRLQGDHNNNKWNEKNNHDKKYCTGDGEWKNGKCHFDDIEERTRLTRRAPSCKRARGLPKRGKKRG